MIESGLLGLVFVDLRQPRTLDLDVFWQRLGAGPAGLQAAHQVVQINLHMQTFSCDIRVQMQDQDLGS